MFLCLLLNENYPTASLSDSSEGGLSYALNIPNSADEHNLSTEWQKYRGG